MTVPRVAFFTDSFHEVNGVARTSREFVHFARERDYPFFSVHTGPKTACWTEENLTTCELKLSRASLRLETDLFLDLLFLRHLPRIGRALRQFRPDLIHITGPGHHGMLGVIAAFLLNVPLAASWHTNVHEYGAKRLATLPPPPSGAAASWDLPFYRMVRIEPDSLAVPLCSLALCA